MDTADDAIKNGPPPEKPGADTVLHTRQIDGLADEFEDHWTENSIDGLESMLSGVPESVKPELRQELLRVDFEIRFKKGKPVKLEDYLQRFSGYGSEIQAAYERLMAARQLGEYDFYELLGKGGMGNVYRGHHRLLGRTVAIKLLNRKILNIVGGMERFLREIRLSGRQVHPNIVNTEYAGKVDDRYYLVMEFIDGANLNDIVKRRGPLPISVACEILRQTAQGLQYVFENGFVHRDIKPGNLMISRQGVVKIIDFGLGKFVASHLEEKHALTTFGTTMGSIDYVAPEQLTDAASATIQADIYSLGCVFFFLLTGHAPFENELMSRDRKLIAHIKGEMPPLSRFCPDCPDEIERFYQKMVACKPQDRFAQPSEVVEVAAMFASPEGLLSLVSDSGELIRNDRSSAVLSKQTELAVPPPTVRAILKRHWPQALLLLAAGYGIYLFGTARKNDVPPLPRDVPSVQVGVEVPVAPPKRNETAEILQFPGYTGQWWFEEIPYLLPIVREKIAVTKTHRSGHPVTDIESSIFATESEPAGKLLEFLFINGETTQKNVADLEILADRYFSEIAATEDHSASVWHTYAVLLHRLAVLRSEPELERLALERYAKALETYETEPTEYSRFLSKLCRFDLARLNYTIGGNAEEFQRETTAISLDDQDDILFRIHLQTIPSIEQMKSGRQQDAVFEEAFQLLKQFGEEVPHPVLITLHTFYADALARQWRLEISEQEWQTVEKLAVQRALHFGATEREARLGAESVRAKLACAALSRYCGDLNTSRYRYRELIGNIQDALGYLPIGKTDSVRLTRQLAEAWEGLADTTLFSPMHFDKDAIQNAAFFLGEAESGYRQALEVSNDPIFKFVQHCKLALLRFRTESLEEDARRDLWEEIREEYWQVSSWNNGFGRARDYYRLLEAVLGAPDDVLPIRAYLDRSRLNPNPYRRYAGEQLDLQLFAIQTLLTAQLESDFSAARQDIKQYLDIILLQHLAPEPKTRPFLLPFYDLAVRSPEEDDWVQVALRIWTARCRHHSDKVADAHLVFYFPLGNAEGFALFLSSDLDQNRRFNLALTRQQVLDAFKSDKKLSLPKELVEIIRAARDQSKALDVSWDDSMCWSAAMAGFRLTIEKWVFETGFDPKGLLGSAK